jgi:RNA polymerase sigma-70 factor (ECF subfamily)
MPTTDAELVRRVLLLQDRGAYCGLVRKYQGEVRAYLLRLTRSREWADDIAQETFLHGFRRLNQLKDHGKYRSWIYSLAHSQFLQWHRGHEVFESGENVEAAHETDFFAGTEVRLLFQNLRPEECSALTLCLAHEFTHAEAAEALKLPLGTVKSLVLRAREKLNATIDDKLGVRV